MTTFPTLADALKDHREDYEARIPTCECGWEQSDDSDHGQFWRDHAESLWREACSLSVEQLDSLPLGSVIKVRGLMNGVVKHYPGIWKASGFEGAWEFDEDELPALLLWHPDWSAS